MNQLIRIQKDSVILPFAPINPHEFFRLVLKYLSERKAIKKTTNLTQLKAIFISLVKC